MSKRNHNVQTPGATPATAPEGDQVDGNAADTQHSADTPETTQPESTAAPAAKPAEQPKAAKKPAEQPKAAKKPAERPNYAQTPAADIDPDTLTAPVLSRDGWVIPTPKTATKA